MNVKQILENYLQYLNFSFYIQLTRAVRICKRIMLKASLPFEQFQLVLSLRIDKTHRRLESKRKRNQLKILFKLLIFYLRVYDG